MQALREALAPNLYRFVSMGSLMRECARRSGFDTIEAFVKHRLDNPGLGIDRRIDAMGNAFGLANYGVLESRLGYVLWPGAFQVRLVCPIEVRAARRAKQTGVSVQEAERLILQRDEDDTQLYQGLYGPGIIWTEDRFDQVVDTSLLTPGQIAQEILDQHGLWKERLGSKAIVKGVSQPQFGVDFDTLWVA
jgi:cytidylate kinase